MSKIELNQQLLEAIKRDAKKKKRKDPSLSYNRLLNELSAPHGFKTYDSLKRHVEMLEKEELDRALAAEEQQWATRLKGPKVWGSIWSTTGDGLIETVPLPVSEGYVVWPNCFAGTSLFSCEGGLRNQRDGPVATIDGPEMLFRGEELRIEDDHTVLQALICVAGRHPCGRVVAFSIEDLDNGKDYDSDFSSRMHGEGVWADLIRQRFEKAVERLGMNLLTASSPSSIRPGSSGLWSCRRL